MSEDFITPRVAYLALGSNLGDRSSNIASAIELLDAQPEIEVFAVANLIATPAMYVDGPEFLNTCIGVHTTLAPHTLLDACLAVEQALGRVRSVDKGPRTIDVDIVLYDDLVLDDERLTIPHPHMLERDFVLIPLAEIAPTILHPTANQTITQLLQ